MTFEDRIFGTKKNTLKAQTIIEGDSSMGGGSFYPPEGQLEQEQREVQLCNGFDTILAELKKDPDDLQSRIERLQSLPDCDHILEKLNPYFTGEHWEMVAVLEAYDKHTFDHSLRVAAFVYEITMEKGETAAYMKEKIGSEQGSLEDLFTAALFHDIGKTAIPRDILLDHTTRREWARHANRWAEKNQEEAYFDPEAIREPEEGGLDTTELDEYLMRVRREKGLDPLDLVPLDALNDVFDETTLREIETHGLSRTGTFKKILERHENATKAILRRKKMYTASDIASLHHGYEERKIRLERYPTETSVLRIGFALSMIRSMDVYDALTSSDRSYKQPHHPLLAMRIILKEAMHDFTDLELTRRIISDLYKQFKGKSGYEEYTLQTRTIKELRRKPELTPTQKQFISKGDQLLSAEKEILTFIHPEEPPVVHSEPHLDQKVA